MDFDSGAPALKDGPSIPCGVRAVETAYLFFEGDRLKTPQTGRRGTRRVPNLCRSEPEF